MTTGNDESITKEAGEAAVETVQAEAESDAPKDTAKNTAEDTEKKEVSKRSLDRVATQEDCAFCFETLSEVRGSHICTVLVFHRSLCFSDARRCPYR